MCGTSGKRKDEEGTNGSINRKLTDDYSDVTWAPSEVNGGRTELYMTEGGY